MAEHADDGLLSNMIFLWHDESRLLDYISYMFISCGFIVIIALQFLYAPYGRYASRNWGFFMNSRLAWFIQEIPSLLVPVLVMYFSECHRLKFVTNKLLICLFLLHYFQRSLVYPFLIKGGKPTPFLPFCMAFAFCSVNGYLQISYLAKYAIFENHIHIQMRIIIGMVLFFIGMVINIQSDSILRNLRKPGETDYKIPKGGLFNYVSGANFLGEILEWSGFALAVWSMSAFSFALFTACNIGPRAAQHHRWYLSKFEDYPKDRKIIIPFIL